MVVQAVNIPRVLSLKEAAARAGICVRTLQRAFAVGEGPARVMLSPRRVGVLESDLNAWLFAKRRPAPGCR